MPKPIRNRKIYSLDSECSGVDVFHGARPFLVTFCDQEQNNTFWEWSVDPLTREVIIEDEQDLDGIQSTIDEADELILQNGTFDQLMLEMLFKDHGRKLRWDWKKVRDTLIAGHLLASNHPHNLTDMAIEYLGVNIEPLETAVDKAVKEIHKLIDKKGSLISDWRRARNSYKYAMPEMPTAKDKCHKFDMWLPRAYAKAKNLPEDHPYWNMTSDYANGDSSITLPLWQEQWRRICRLKLDKIFMERMKLPVVINHIKRRGVTANKDRQQKIQKRFKIKSESANRVCMGIAEKLGYDLNLPKNGNNKSLLTFAFDVLKLPAIKTSKKTGDASFDSKCLDHYLATLPEDSDAYKFVLELRGKRKCDTMISYVNGYEHFWQPTGKFNASGQQLWFRLYPGLNCTGTDTLRWSSSNPNFQNCGKQDDFNVREIFGPLPGREWWSCDGQNLELRIPAYEAGETEMINLFERPDDPPYFGSNHLLVSDILHPERFRDCYDYDAFIKAHVDNKFDLNLYKRLRKRSNGVDGRIFKKLYAATWYQWVKNGNFAVQYGAVEVSGTADRAYHVPGAQHIIQGRFTEIAKLNKSMIAYANEHGYVETLPDKTVDPRRGYPLLCARSNWGGIKETIPLNYHIQGTACQWMNKAMVRCYDYLSTLNRKAGSRGYYIIAQIHDELVLDFPKGTGSEPWRINLPIMRKIQQLMAKGGDDIGIPTPVSLEYVPVHWADGQSIKQAV